MAHGRIVIGLGTGRCGTATLAALLDRQPGCAASHEAPGPSLTWQGGERVLDAVLDELESRVEGGLRVAAAVGFYYLPYVARIRARFPTARFIVLRRDRAATVESFINKTRTKANHWAPTPRFARHTRWNGCFPVYPAALAKAEAIGRYWDEYYATADALAAAAPESFLTVPTETLSDAATQRALLDFAGVPAVEQILVPDLVLNRGAARPERDLRDICLSFWTRLTRGRAG